MKPQKHNKYAYVPDRVIDLHGMTVADAAAALIDVLDNRGTQKVRIITGKGNHSAGGVGLVRQEIKRLLAARTIPWKYAKLDQGGEGVIDIG